MYRRWMAVLLGAMALGIVTECKLAAEPADDAALRSQILESSAWRRAMFEVNEWLLAQRVYTPQQVEEMRTQFRQRVNEMSGADLKLLLGDLETKLQIIDTPQAREAKAWMGEYVAVLAERRRAEVLRDLPNLATLTSSQLHQEIVRIKQKRSTLDSRQRGAAQSVAARRVDGTIAASGSATTRASASQSPSSVLAVPFTSERERSVEQHRGRRLSARVLCRSMG